MANSKDKIWFFGCSLTFGSGLELVDSDHGSRWSRLVADNFGRVEENRGSPGGSNEMILLNIREDFHNIGPRDWVILQTTFAGRTFGFHRESDLPVRFNSMNPNKTDERLLKHHGDEHKFSVLHPKTGTRTYFPHSNSSIQLHKDLSEYCANVRLPYLNKWSNHFEKEFFFYKTILEDKCEKVIYWDYNERYAYETIEQATKGKVQDFHFSVKGHYDFSKKIIGELVA